MISLPDISPEVLRNYHHLTAVQINIIHGREVIAGSIDTKATSLATFGELITVAEAMGRSGISFVSLKGPLLAYRLYGDVTARYYTDLDILTESGSAGHAADVLEQMGYTGAGLAWPRAARLQRMLMKHDNQVGYVHHDRMMTVELHWRLLANTSMSAKDLEAVVSRNTMSIRVGEHSFNVLSNELEILYLIIHGGKHYWRRLKWMVDVDTFIRTQEVDPGKFREMVSLFRAERMVTLFAAVHACCFPDDCSGRVHSLIKDFVGSTPRITTRMVRFALKEFSQEEDKIHNSISGIFQSVLFKLRSFPGLSYKLRVICNYFFVKDYLGKSRFFGRIPLFYFYSAFLLMVNRLKR